MAERGVEEITAGRDGAAGKEYQKADGREQGDSDRDMLRIGRMSGSAVDWVLFRGMGGPRLGGAQDLLVPASGSRRYCVASRVEGGSNTILPLLPGRTSSHRPSEERIETRKGRPRVSPFSGSSAVEWLVLPTSMSGCYLEVHIARVSVRRPLHGACCDRNGCCDGHVAFPHSSAYSC